MDDIDRGRRIMIGGGMGLLCGILSSCVSTPTPVSAAAREQARPIRLLFLQDKTGSSLQNGLPNLTPIILRDGAEIATRWGGEVALGVIDAKGTQPLIRLAFKPKPVMPEVLANPYQRPAAQAALDRWEKTAKEELEQFIVQGSALLAKPNSDKKTNVEAAFLRASSFFGEQGETDARRVMVIVSDLEHDANNHKLPALANRVECLVVAGIARPKLAGARYFEGLGAALHYVEKGQDEKGQERSSL